VRLKLAVRRGLPPVRGVEGIEFERPPVQEGVLVEGAEEVIPVPAGGLGRDVDGVEVAGRHLLGDPLDEGLGAGAVVVHREAGADFLTLAVHQTNSVALAVDIHAHQKGIGHRCFLLS